MAGGVVPRGAGGTGDSGGVRGGAAGGGGGVWGRGAVATAASESGLSLRGGALSFTHAPVVPPGDAIAARLTGRKIPRAPLRYFNQCISLGRHDGIIQFVTADDRAKPAAVTGRPAARIKEFICAGAGWSIGHPTVLLPTRRRHTSPALATAGSSAR